jgi:hypothetical protein
MEMDLLSFTIRAPDNNPRLRQVPMSRSTVRLYQGTLPLQWTTTRDAQRIKSTALLHESRLFYRELSDLAKEAGLARFCSARLPQPGSSDGTRINLAYSVSTLPMTWVSVTCFYTNMGEHATSVRDYSSLLQPASVSPSNSDVGDNYCVPLCLALTSTTHSHPSYVCSRLSLNPTGVRQASGPVVVLPPSYQRHPQPARCSVRSVHSSHASNGYGPSIELHPVVASRQHSPPASVESHRPIQPRFRGIRRDHAIH